MIISWGDLSMIRVVKLGILCSLRFCKKLGLFLTGSIKASIFS
jgi:hypothetical protein